MSNAIESDRGSTPVAEASAPKHERKPKKARPAKRAGRAKKTVGKPAAARSNKKADVIALLKRVKGAKSPDH